MGVLKLHPPKLGTSGVTCPWAQNGGCKLHPPGGPMWGSVAHCSFGVERVIGDGEWVERLPEVGDGQWVEWLCKEGDGE